MEGTFTYISDVTKMLKSGEQSVVGAHGENSDCVILRSRH